MKFKFFATVFFLFAGNASAATETFDIDPVHTRVAFLVSHAGFSNAIGTFSGSTGQLQFDEKDWSQSSITVSIPVASLNLGDEDWQKKILDGTFFDVGKYAKASFVSQRVEKISDTNGIAHGVLTIRNISQPVSLDFSLNSLKRHPLNFKRTIGFSATAKISRKAFGMDAWSTLIGDDVKIMIELEAAKAKSVTNLEPANDTAK